MLEIRTIDEASKKALYIELGMKSGQQKNQEEAPKNKGNTDASIVWKRNDRKKHCKHCDVDRHANETCWKLHPKLCMKWYKSKKGAMTATKIEDRVIKSNFDVDDLVCVTLQQPRTSEERNELFQVKAQVKNKKVNALFNRVLNVMHFLQR